MLPTGILSFSFLSLAALAKAGAPSFNWDITWVTANPDGQFARPVIGVNNAWPCPTINVTVGDTVTVTINNKLGNETTGLHFHGIDQIGTPEMDGPSGVTQCPVPPGSSMTYQFVVNAPGTYWWHSHNMGQYPDGLRGALIVNDPQDPYKGQYDEEVILTVSDWYHDQTITLIQNMETKANTAQFLPPFPNGIIVNDGTGAMIPFVKGKTYRIRLISFAAFAAAMLHINSHTMQVIMNDGAYVSEAQAYQLRVAPAQRYDFLIQAIDRDNGNFPFLLSLDMNRDYTSDPSQLVWPHNFTGYLVMDPSQPTTAIDEVDSWRPVDDSHFTALDGTCAYGPPTQTIVLNFNFCVDPNGLPRACFNNQPYVPQKVPTLYSVATTGTSNTDTSIYGLINPFIVNYGDVVEIVINNGDGAIHPFHLHGHQFQVLDRPSSGTGAWPGRDVNYNTKPPKRDTLAVMANSFAVLRYVATNPGVFLFHCHIEWHVEMGLTATIIEAPDRLRNMTFPPDHLKNCQIQNIPTAGNAAGNTANVTDTSDFNTVIPENYTGSLYFPPSSSKRSRVWRLDE